MQVTGASMAPVLTSGDTVAVEPLGGRRLRAGDIVLYRDPTGAPVIHRVLVSTRRSIRTKGDALGGLDAPITPEKVLGRVTHRARGDRTVDLTTPTRRLLAFLTASWQLARVAARRGVRRP
jgi:signal peptidase I